MFAANLVPASDTSVADTSSSDSSAGEQSSQGNTIPKNADLSLSKKISQSIFKRDGNIEKIIVYLNEV